MRPQCWDEQLEMRHAMSFHCRVIEEQGVSRTARNCDEISPERPRTLVTDTRNPSSLQSELESPSECDSGRTVVLFRYPSNDLQSQTENEQRAPRIIGSLMSRGS